MELANYHSILERLETLSEHLPVREFYTTKEFAEKTGLSIATINKYLVARMLRGHQIAHGKGWIILASEVKRLKAEAEQNYSPNRTIKTNSLSKIRQKNIKEAQIQHNDSLKMKHYS